jgi:hypothetical protein
MSEEILKALMQLFAIIVKQDEGVEHGEWEYVKIFLTLQLNDEAANEYLALFDSYAGLDKPDENPEENGKKKNRNPEIEKSFQPYAGSSWPVPSFPRFPRPLK